MIDLLGSGGPGGSQGAAVEVGDRNSPCTAALEPSGIYPLGFLAGEEKKSQDESGGTVMNL